MSDIMPDEIYAFKYKDEHLSIITSNYSEIEHSPITLEGHGKVLCIDEYIRKDIYQALQVENKRLREALELVLGDVEWRPNSVTKKYIKRTLKESGR